MKRYADYQIEDFAQDDTFVSWCLRPDAASDTFWHRWMSDHPQQKDVILQAKQLVVDLQLIETEAIEDNYEEEIWNNIEASISLPSAKRVGISWQAWSAAAVVLLIIGFSFWIGLFASHDAGEKLADLEWVNFENNTGVAKTIELSDGSTVVLEPFSTLKYPSRFQTDSRMVFLQGEGFFDIARDTLTPFLVYANETITKVLGTSFTIKAFAGEETVEVDVKSGKVAVYAHVESQQDMKPQKTMLIETDEKIFLPRPNKKLEVTPNQKVVFDRKVENLFKQVTPIPTLVTELEKLPQYAFEDASLVTIFEALELAYGIDLVFDEASLQHCTLTTKLKNESLFEKLDIISTALNLTYSEEDATIVIAGEGC